MRSTRLPRKPFDMLLRNAAVLVVCLALAQQGACAGWVNVRNNMTAFMPLQVSSGTAGPTNMIASPDKDIVYAWKWQQNPIMSTDGGNTWTQCGQTAGSATVNVGMTTVLFDPQNSDVMFMNGMYGLGGGGLFKTTNGGASFYQYSNSSGHCDGLGIDFTDPQRKTMIMGGHEQAKTVYRTTDGGNTWTNIGGTLPGGGFSSYLTLIDATTYLVSECGYSGNNGLQKSTDGGATWTKIATQSPYGPPLFSSTGKIYWAVSGGGILSSADNGATWTESIASGNRTSFGAWQGILGEMSGSLITISSDDKRVIELSSDGKSWSTVATIPFTITDGVSAGVSYSKVRNCIYVWAEPQVYRYDLSSSTVAAAAPVRTGVAVRPAISVQSGRIVIRRGHGVRNGMIDVRGKLVSVTVND